MRPRSLPSRSFSIHHTSASVPFTVYILQLLTASWSNPQETFKCYTTEMGYRPRAVHTWTDVSDKRITSIFRVENQRSAGSWFLSGLIFYPVDGGDTFLRNVDAHTDYMTLYPMYRCENLNSYFRRREKKVFRCWNCFLPADRYETRHLVTSAYPTRRTEWRVVYELCTERHDDGLWRRMLSRDADCNCIRVSVIKSAQKSAGSLYYSRHEAWQLKAWRHFSVYVMSQNL
jgi:hypothetical protein